LFVFQKEFTVRRVITFLARSLPAVLAVAASGAIANSQSQSYTSQKIGYSLDFPSATWRLVDEPDDLRQHTEFVYGDRIDGYLRIRKESMDEGITINDFAHRDQDQKTRFLPGYVDGKEEPFTGKLSGVTSSYEFTERGKPMAGRTYYLQGDGRTVYVLRFTGLRDKLLRIRNQTDSIARSLRSS
jgi:hypothetical protein